MTTIHVTLLDIQEESSDVYVHPCRHHFVATKIQIKFVIIVYNSPIDCWMDLILASRASLVLSKQSLQQSSPFTLK